MMPSGSCSKNQLIPPETPNLQPKLVSRNSVFTSQGQSTAVAILRAWLQRSDSPGRPARGPSAAIYSLGGRAARIASKTRDVVSGRLKIRNRTALFMEHISRYLADT